jgi:hypothetical protein
MLGMLVGLSLVERLELLGQLLARAHPGDADLDVGARLAARQPDHPLGQVVDLHRLAHVEHEHLAAGALVGQRGGLQARAAPPLRST